MKNPQNFIFPFLLGNQAKQHLESKNVAVEGNFVIRQSLIGWMLDNPWAYAFLMQNEINQLDTASSDVAKAEIEKLKVEKTELEYQVKTKDETIERMKEEMVILQRKFESYHWKIALIWQKLTAVIGRLIRMFINNVKAQMRRGITHAEAWIAGAQRKQWEWLEQTREHGKP